MGGGFSHTSVSPWRCTSARALPGLDSRCRMREACAYNTGSAATASQAGMRITLRSRSRSEEHTSELQSRFDLVCRLLLEKKKTQCNYDIPAYTNAFSIYGI